MYYYYGNDIRLLDKEILSLCSSLLEKNAGYELYSSSINNSGDLDFLFSSDSLFDSYYVIKIKKDKDFKPKLLSLKDSKHILVFYSYDEKDTFSKEFGKDYDITIKEFNLPKPWNIEKMLSARLGKLIAPEIIPYIASFIQSTLEIEDILININALDITQLNLSNYKLVIPYAEINIFVMVDSFFTKNTALFLSQLKDFLLSGESIEQFIGALHKKIMGFINIKKMQQNGQSMEEISRYLGIPTFILKKNLGTVSAFSLYQLENMGIKVIQTQFLVRQSAGIADQYYLEKLYLEKVATH